MAKDEDRVQSESGSDIRKERSRIQEALTRLDEHKPNVPGDVKNKVGVVLNSYRRSLRRYRDEQALEVDWDERGVDVLDEYLNQMVYVEVPLNRRGAAKESREELAIRHVPAQTLNRIGEELLDIDKELGFSKQAKNPTPNTEATHDDLAGLLKARGQTQALENLPESWRGED